MPDKDSFGLVVCLFFIDIESYNDCSKPESYVVADPTRTTINIQTPISRGF